MAMALDQLLAPRSGLDPPQFPQALDGECGQRAPQPGWALGLLAAPEAQGQSEEPQWGAPVVL